MHELATAPGDRNGGKRALFPLVLTPTCATQQLYEKTLRALTPPGDKDIDQLITNMRYRMSQMKIGTIERVGHMLKHQK